MITGAYIFDPQYAFNTKALLNKYTHVISMILWQKDRVVKVL